MKQYKQPLNFLKDGRNIQKETQNKKINKGIFAQVYLSLLKEKVKKKPLGIPRDYPAGYYISKGIHRIRPLLDLQRVRRKGRTYFIPYEIKKEKARIIAMKWIKEGSQKNSKGKNQSISKALALLFFESMKGEGYGKKKQKEHHTLANMNKSYIRFRWW